MGIFEYKAVNREGTAVAGTVEAETKAKASEKLVKQGYRPLTLKQQRTGFDPNNIRIPGFTNKVKTKDMVIFTRQLSTMINAGVPLVRAMNTLKQQTSNEYFKEVLLEVSKDVEGGLSLGDSMAKHPKVFSPIYVNMVKAGETGGILDEILKKLALQQEKDAAIKHKLKSAMSYPIVLIVIMTIAFFALTIFVIPSIGKMITDLSDGKAELPIYTKVMLGFSEFMVSYWWVLIIGAVVGIYLFRRWIKTPKGKYAFHKTLLKIPVLKDVITKVAIARFSRIFASLMSSGVPVTESIEVTANAIGNKVIEAELKNASKEVVNGKQLSEPLAASSIFPPIVSQMLAIGEETGQTDTILLKVADFYEEEVDAVVDSLAAIIEPIMILVMGALVGLIAASVIGPISSLSQNL